ncbi:MAG TPA: hypothetical protein P5279_03475 [Anaerohalosphaeraceae bacterium]|nr:hypothetical protein [Anaerohalosphaeraceae bacterium]HRT49531.1 hypothetical protein [Anaerohalosphaeraceae bacterium]HRT85307.1 hypothetical protein [Anaerohalosphaeraceae bacterium]
MTFLLFVLRNGRRDQVDGSFDGNAAARCGKAAGADQAGKHFEYLLQGVVFRTRRPPIRGLAPRRPGPYEIAAGPEFADRLVFECVKSSVIHVCTFAPPRVGGILDNPFEQAL